MTALQKKLEEAIDKLNAEEKEYNNLHKQAELKRKNVIVPLQLEVKSLLVQVQGERKSNCNIKST